MSARGRLPFLLIAILALLAALWAGLLRIGWPWPAPQPLFPLTHGPLIISGFLGALIGVERAIALESRAAYLAPLAAGLGSLFMLAGLWWQPALVLMALGSLGLLLVNIAIVRRHPAIYTATMAAGALAWLVGNLLLVAGRPVFQATPWWMAFLVLTICGERLELSRVMQHGRASHSLFMAATAVLSLGIILTLPAYEAGMRVAGLGLLLFTVWLLRYDIFRRTMRKEGLTRFIGISLFLGTLWLGIGGLLALVYGGLPAGPLYDAMLHTVFVGFVMSMIFGHAPLIFPAVLGRPMAWLPLFYSHLALLHISLVMRIAGDLLSYPELRRWGGLLNAVAILCFLVNTIISLWVGGQQQYGVAESVPSNDEQG